MSLQAMLWALQAPEAAQASDGARLVLISLADAATADGSAAWPSARTIAEGLVVSVRTVRRRLEELEERGLIRRGDQRLVGHLRADRRPTVYDLAMAPPLTGTDQVQYQDGTRATVDQMAKDVSAFLVWTAEPKLDKRKQTGWPVLGFLLFATVLAYLAKQQVWAGKKGH